MKTSTQKRVHKIGEKKVFDKYDYYTKAVQSADSDVEFFKKVHSEAGGKNPQILREDFCGTFELSQTWVESGAKLKAIGLDLDPEPIEYGKNRFNRKATDSQKSRLQILEKNVLQGPLPKADVIAALNFSYFIFQERETLKSYFKNCFESLLPKGVLIADIFGGSLCYDQNEEKTVHKQFTYFWEQAGFDPVHNKAVFHIHFRPKGSAKLERVFTYDWRMWSIPEIRDLMREVGFKTTHVYWEGTTKKGTGNGIFTRTEKGESCQSWIAYIVGVK
jgi:hypothetical protein